MMCLNTNLLDRVNARASSLSYSFFFILLYFKITDTLTNLWHAEINTGVQIMQSWKGYVERFRTILKEQP